MEILFSPLEIFFSRLEGTLGARVGGCPRGLIVPNSPGKIMSSREGSMFSITSFSFPNFSIFYSHAAGSESQDSNEAPKMKQDEGETAEVPEEEMNLKLTKGHKGKAEDVLKQLRLLDWNPFCCLQHTDFRCLPIDRLHIAYVLLCLNLEFF